MHCAHPDGLGCPIVGDELYGHQQRLAPDGTARLFLHAEELWLQHPVSREALHFVDPRPF
jgi:tRNA pseudouridine32 synthase/23S rRNA pseudouridine746 synthase